MQGRDREQHGQIGAEIVGDQGKTQDADPHLEVARIAGLGIDALGQELAGTGWGLEFGDANQGAQIEMFQTQVSDPNGEGFDGLPATSRAG